MLRGIDCDEVLKKPGYTVHCTHCRDDYCNNGAAISTPPVPVLIAIVASAIAALGL